MIPSRLLNAPEGDIGDGKPLAPTLYTGQTTKDWSTHIPNEVIPRIVRSIFALTSLGSSPSHILSILRLQFILIDAEASSIQLVDSEQWLASLMKRISTVSTCSATRTHS